MTWGEPMAKFIFHCEPDKLLMCATAAIEIDQKKIRGECSVQHDDGTHSFVRKNAHGTLTVWHWEFSGAAINVNSRVATLKT